MAFKIALAGDGAMVRYLLDRLGGDTAPWPLVNEARELRKIAEGRGEQ